MKVQLHGDSLWLWCPACEDAHRIVVGTADSWQWDGNVDSPTITPSIKVTGVQWPEDTPFRRPNHHGEPGDPVVCHSFVTGGRWQFLSDCTHDRAGESVPMVDLPDWLDVP